MMNLSGREHGLNVKDPGSTQALPPQYTTKK